MESQACTDSQMYCLVYEECLINLSSLEVEATILRTPVTQLNCIQLLCTAHIKFEVGTWHIIRRQVSNGIIEV